MTTAARPMTLERFMELEDPETGHLELINGEVVCMAGGTSDHGLLSGELAGLLWGFSRQHRLGNVVTNANFHVRSNPDWAPVPDVAFVSTARWAIIYRKADAFAGAPDLAIEVVSPTNKHSHVIAKVLAYFAGGAQRVWVVDPATSTVTVHRGDHSARTYSVGDVLASDDAAFGVEGFELPLAEVFPASGLI